jgi:hypothetical protein
MRRRKSTFEGGTEETIRVLCEKLSPAFPPALLLGQLLNRGGKIVTRSGANRGRKNPRLTSTDI